MAKSWREKFFSKKNFEIKTIQKNFWGHVAGSKMLIPTPLIIQEYINHIESGKISEVKIMMVKSNQNISITNDLLMKINLKIIENVVGKRVIDSLKWVIDSNIVNGI